MTLREAKQIIRQWIRTHFDDQRLTAVYAFNADRHMEWSSQCGCLLGVTLTEGALHRRRCGNGHYSLTDRLTGAAEAEEAYLVLGYLGDFNNDGRRRVRLSAILRAELHRRDRERSSAAQQTLEQQAVSV